MKRRAPWLAGLAATALLAACGGSEQSDETAPAETADPAASGPAANASPVPTTTTTATPSPSPIPSPPGSASPGPTPSGTVSACLMQGSERLAIAPLRAVGTEPFWGAAIEGRCVTYSHPDDQKGTRVWTRYTSGADGGGSWRGTLNGKPFVLTTRRQAGCSDGMSDRRYPLAVALTVGGEARQGCAAPR